MSVVIQSNSPSSADLFPEFTLYKNRVIADGGIIRDEASVLSMFIYLKEMGLKEDNIFSATATRWGCKLSGSNVIKLYNLFDASGDITVTAGTYADSNVNGMGFYSAGSAANKMKSIGVLSGTNKLSVFASFTKGSSTTATNAAMCEYWDDDLDYRGLNISYAHNTNTHSSNAYTISGSLSGIAHTKNIGASVNISEGLNIIQNGLVTATDLTLTAPTERNYSLYLASAEPNIAGSQGYYHAVIACNDLTLNQCKEITKYLEANFGSS